MRALSKTLAITVLVAAIAVVGIAAYLLMSKGSPSTKGENVTTTATQQPSLEACLKGPSAIIVYESGEKNFADTLLQYVEKQLASNLPPGTKFCALSAKETGLTSLPMYPALVFKLGMDEIKGKLRDFVLNATLPGGYIPFRYDYFASFATQLGMYLGKGAPKYTHEAKIIIVNGDAPGTQVNEKYLGAAKGRLAVVLSAIFVADVKDIQVVDKPPTNIVPDEYPAVYAESNADLAKYNPDLREVAPGIYYDYKDSLAELLAGLGLVPAALIKYKPIPYLDKHPALGSGEIHIAIFDDIMCPYCARLYINVMPKLVEYAKNNTVTIHILDLPVHQSQEALVFHKLMLCYYNKTHNAWKYYEIFHDTYKQLYSYILSGKAEQKLAEIVKKLREELNTTELCPAAKYVELSIQHSQDVGIRGVPGIVIWKKGGKHMLVAMGYHDIDWFMEAIKWMKTH